MKIRKFKVWNWKNIAPFLAVYLTLLGLSIAAIVVNRFHLEVAAWIAISVTNSASLFVIGMSLYNRRQFQKTITFYSDEGVAVCMNNCNSSQEDIKLAISDTLNFWCAHRPQHAKAIANFFNGAILIMRPEILEWHGVYGARKALGLSFLNLVYVSHFKPEIVPQIVRHEFAHVALNVTGEGSESYSHMVMKNEGWAY